MQLRLAHSNRTLAIFDALLLTGYLAFIYWLSALPSLPAPVIFTWQDKLYHAGAYFVMSLLAWRSVRHFAQKFSRQLLIAGVFCSFYGITDEWHQVFVPGRTADVSDWLADTLGALLAAVVIKTYAENRRDF